MTARGPCGALLLLTLMNPLLWAQPGGKVDPVQSLTVKALPIPARVGEPHVYEVTLQLAAGWHVNANPASEKFLKPTVVTAAESSLKIIDVKYPTAEEIRMEGFDKPVKVYSGIVKMIVKAEPPAPSAQPALQVDYQACDNKRCLPPTKKFVPIKP